MSVSHIFSEIKNYYFAMLKLSQLCRIADKNNTGNCHPIFLGVETIPTIFIIFWCLQIVTKQKNAHSNQS